MSMFTLPTNRSTVAKTEELSVQTCRRIGLGLMLLSTLVTLSGCSYLFSLF